MRCYLVVAVVPVIVLAALADIAFFVYRRAAAHYNVLGSSLSNLESERETKHITIQRAIEFEKNSFGCFNHVPVYPLLKYAAKAHYSFKMSPITDYNVVLHSYCSYFEKMSTKSQCDTSHNPSLKAITYAIYLSIYYLCQSDQEYITNFDRLCFISSILSKNSLQKVFETAMASRARFKKIPHAPTMDSKNFSTDLVITDDEYMGRLRAVVCDSFSPSKIPASYCVLNPGIDLLNAVNTLRAQIAVRGASIKDIFGLMTSCATNYPQYISLLKLQFIGEYNESFNPIYHGLVFNRHKRLDFFIQYYRDIQDLRFLQYFLNNFLLKYINVVSFPYNNAMLYLLCNEKRTLPPYLLRVRSWTDYNVQKYSSLLWHALGIVRCSNMILCEIIHDYDIANLSRNFNYKVSRQIESNYKMKLFRLIEAFCAKHHSLDLHTSMYVSETVSYVLNTLKLYALLGKHNLIALFTCHPIGEIVDESADSPLVSYFFQFNCYRFWLTTLAFQKIPGAIKCLQAITDEYTRELASASRLGAYTIVLSCIHHYFELLIERIQKKF